MISNNKMNFVKLVVKYLETKSTCWKNYRKKKYAKLDLQIMLYIAL